MIEKIVCDYLSGALGMTVRFEVPEKYSTPLVVVERTSGSVSNHIHTATLAIQSYADSIWQAALLNERVKEAMDNMITLPMISRSMLNSDYNYTDTESKRYRYQAVYDLVYFKWEEVQE